MKLFPNEMAVASTKRDEQPPTNPVVIVSIIKRNEDFSDQLRVNGRVSKFFESFFPHACKNVQTVHVLLFVWTTWKYRLHGFQLTNEPTNDQPTTTIISGPLLASEKYDLIATKVVINTTWNQSQEINYDNFGLLSLVCNQMFDDGCG